MKIAKIREKNGINSFGINCLVLEYSGTSQMAKMSREHTTGITEDFSYSNINWESNSIASGKYNSFLMSLAENFIVQRSGKEN